MQVRHETFRLPATQKAVSKSKRRREPDNRCNPETMISNYLDMYEGVHTDVIYTNRFDQSSDLSATYLGKTKLTMETKIKAVEKFPISGQGYTLGKLLDGMECQILLDTGARKSYMSKSFYLRCQTLHTLPKFTSNTQNMCWKWSVCGCTVCNTGDNRCSCSQV